MKSNDKVKLSKEELEIICILEHNLFSDKILTDELNSNSCSIMQVRAKGFFEAVSLMANFGVQDKIYRKVKKQYELEDILLNLDRIDEDNHCGFDIDEIAQDDAVIEEIWNTLEERGDCNVSYNSQVDEAIKTILERKCSREVSK